MKTQKLRERKKKEEKKRNNKKKIVSEERWKARNQNQKSPITECECVTNKGAQSVYYQNIDFIILHIAYNTNTHVSKGEWANSLNIRLSADVYRTRKVLRRAQVFFLFFIGSLSFLTFVFILFFCSVSFSSHLIENGRINIPVKRAKWEVKENVNASHVYFYFGYNFIAKRGKMMHRVFGARLKPTYSILLYEKRRKRFWFFSIIFH